jgi:hypothetical protein
MGGSGSVTSVFVSLSRAGQGRAISSSKVRSCRSRRKRKNCGVFVGWLWPGYTGTGHVMYGYDALSVLGEKTGRREKEVCWYIGIYM